MTSPDAVPDTFARVLLGTEGWRFLGDGNNLSISQMVGLASPSIGVRHLWSLVLRSRMSRYGARTKTFVMPEKACLYQRYLPDGLRVHPERFGFWLSGIGWADYVFRDRLERQDADDLYYRGDSHTTAYGSHVAATEILRTMGLDTDGFHPTWATAPVSCFDLYEPGEPRPASSERVVANGPAVEVTTNGLHNRGCVMRLVNPAGILHRLLIFGDSFGSLLSHGFARYVREVVFVHAVNFDYEIIERYRPDTVVGEIAERFLIEPPSEGTSLPWIVESKLIDDAISPAEAAQFTASYARFADLYGPAMAPTLAEVRRRFGA